jgi:hypothetical protein
MTKQLKFICAQPDDTYYTWQVHLWLESLRKLGHSDKDIVLLFIPHGRQRNTKWDQIIELYPEAEFKFYKDEKNEMSTLLTIYIPILRPYCLMRYFNENPEMEKHAIFYCDSDVIFTENFNVDKYIDDDINYLSDTNSYISSIYFDSKEKDVLPSKLEEYKKRDILGELCEMNHITREIAEKYKEHSGGAQYLLKNINALFWERVLSSSITIRLQLQKFNREFFESESKGFQSWCADMWGVLWNVWRNNGETQIIPEMEFSWSSDPISKLERTGILHNAGITDKFMGGSYPAFYKGSYISGMNPLADSHLQVVLNDEQSKKHCTHYYLTKLIELQEKYKLNY